MREQAKALVAQMTLEEKASLCSGYDFWTLKPLERLGLPRVMVTDGPHGLRKQAGNSDHLGINDSVPATCFPAACATGASFDRDLMRAVGVALGEECQQENVAAILGPGANLKRSPLCGRNFEYFSEDPFHTGAMAAAHIDGVQSQGVGTSLKHYAANNQETRRMTVDSIVDERALREIYLTGFEMAVKQSKPWTVMCAYNRINGTYACEHKRLLTTILRDEWGFEGLVVTDWGAMNERVEGVAAGLDLQMPGPADFDDASIVKAVQGGMLSQDELDAVVVRNVQMVLRYQQEHKQGATYDAAAHHALARKASAQSAVLLKNQDGLLPLAPSASIAVIGAFAKTPRYQGAGSSKINPTQLDEPVAQLQALGLRVAYAPGYDPMSDEIDDALIAEACALAKEQETVLIYAGLPDRYESEGFDRTSLDLPQNHDRLIQEVAKVNPNVAVVLLCGAPVLMPWMDQVKSILLAYIGGQAVGGGLADVLTGRTNPSGKLPETFPLALADTPCAQYFAEAHLTTQYRESIFVGYRYYDATAQPIAFPFGHGLSYTSFAYSDLSLSSAHYAQNDAFTAQVSLTNTGNCAGAEVVQLYVGRDQEAVFRAPKELRGFEKVCLQPGETKRISFALDARSFAYYNTAAAAWAIEGGTYQIMLGSSSQDIHVQAPLQVQGDGKEALLKDLYAKLPTYFSLPKGPFAVSAQEFETLYGAPLPPSDPQAGAPLTLNTMVGDIMHHPKSDLLLTKIKEGLGALSAGSDESIDRMFAVMLGGLPLRAASMFSGNALSRDALQELLDEMNA